MSVGIQTSRASSIFYGLAIALVLELKNYV